jgi:hypothetical protein
VSAKTRRFPRGLRCWPSLSLPAGLWWLLACSHLVTWENSPASSRSRWSMRCWLSAALRSGGSASSRPGWWSTCCGRCVVRASRLPGRLAQAHQRPGGRRRRVGHGRRLVAGPYQAGSGAAAGPCLTCCAAAPPRRAPAGRGGGGCWCARSTAPRWMCRTQPLHLQGHDQHRHLDEPAQPLTTWPWAKARRLR